MGVGHPGAEMGQGGPNWKSMGARNRPGPSIDNFLPSGGGWTVVEER
jgi:hypothetical protein